MERISVILLDTDILIDVGRGVKTSVDVVKHITDESTIAISIVTQMELVIGCRNKSELQKLNKFLKNFQIISLDVEISKNALELLKKFRLSHGLLIADSLIAATALTYNLPLATRNVRDFKFIPKIQLL
ncbi:MAG: type II toxin-antitoxin system VapC family toxin [Chlorobi bacterium]|nr:type II toxin-antitoxin system VapC family toxin [Chlorobiota bacterium]